ncbi:YqaA family protein [Yunchengibacter salinarum]|uniref:YqaA family protein n=1 Tax=Yunchengibacter salinarum TaxID=3133399 RepID=UPI0035B693B0
MLKRLYHWSMARIAGPNGRRWLAGLSFAEASFFPIPPDVLLLPMVLADRARAWHLATITTLSSIAGAVLGYAIGALAREAVAEPLIRFYGQEDAYARFEALYSDYGLLIVVAGGLTPLPFKVITIASGMAGLNPLFFLAACVPARAPRFFAEAALLWWFGPPIRDFLERRFALALTLFTLAGLAGFALLAYL